MANTGAAKGMDRALSSKVAGKYDAGSEAACNGWIQELVGEDIGQGITNVEKSLRNGQILVKLINKVYEGTPNLPPACNGVKLKGNTSELAFKQMENIEIFLNAASKYGVPQNSLFPSSDLFDGKNMAMVLNTILQLGTECQRNGFSGPTIGPKPSEKHVVQFTHEQLKAGQGIIGLQAGTNKCASQAGMKFGPRKIADLKVTEMDKTGQGIIGLQAGTNKCASQAGMKMGVGRTGIADMKLTDMAKEGQSTIGLQAGTNKLASQAGMSMGATRHIADIRCDDMSKDGQSVIGLQAGTNQCASQAGMSMGAVRHVSDMKITEMANEGKSVIGLQAGSNKHASQAGMSMGAIRHVSDIRTDDMDKQGAGIISLQAGTNQYASQTGMSMGAQRHIVDIKTPEICAESMATINLQYGSNKGANQSGMGCGRRDIMVAEGAAQPYM